MNDTFLKACRGEKTEYTPVWFMRQAGRYLPEYQAVRGKVTFLELCKNPELCTEVTLQPIDIFGFDAAILFSDILLAMEAMGLTLEFHEGRGPVFPYLVRNQAAIDKLIVPDTDETMPLVMETIWVESCSVVVNSMAKLSISNLPAGNGSGGKLVESMALRKMPYAYSAPASAA